MYRSVMLMETLSRSSAREMDWFVGKFSLIRLIMYLIVHFLNYLYGAVKFK